MPYIVVKSTEPKGWFVVNEKTGKKFSKKPFKTKKEAVQQLKALYVHLQGGGLVSNFVSGVKSRLEAFKGVRLDYRPKDREFIKKYGDWNIIQLSVDRQPLDSFVKKFANILSFGKFKAILDKHYDEVYHIFCHILLEKPMGEGIKPRKDIILEKNQTIQINDYTDGDRKNATSFPVKVPTNPPLTFKTFLDKGEASVDKDTYFRYDALAKNCGQFISLLLKANDLEKDSPGASDFIFQDLRALRDQLPTVTKKLFKGITDLAGVADVAINGSGLKKLKASDVKLLGKHMGVKKGKKADVIGGILEKIKGGMLSSSSGEHNKNVPAHIDQIVVALMDMFDTNSAQRTSIRNQLEALPVSKRSQAEAIRMAKAMGIPEYDEFL